MSQKSLSSLADSQTVATIAKGVNQALNTYTDKYWKYSRIVLQIRDLQTITSPYVLWIEVLNTRTKDGRSQLRSLSAEVIWGERHSNELGILEIVSLRINKALLEITDDASWNSQRPVLRIVSREVLAQQGVRDAIWYEVREVSGEDFDNR